MVIIYKKNKLKINKKIIEKYFGKNYNINEVNYILDEALEIYFNNKYFK